MSIAVSLAEVVEVLELAHDEMSSYVNQKTGKVVSIPHDELRLAEEEKTDDLPEWEREVVAQARDILDSDDWLELPGKFEIHEWEIMSRFGQSLENAAQQDAIDDAIHGKGAFRMFQSTIRRLGIEQDWYAYKQRALEDMAREWLETHDLGIDEGRPTST